MSSIPDLAPYKPRPIRFLELFEPAGWKLKVYGITAEGERPADELISAAKRTVEGKLGDLTDGVDHYGVGFLGIHAGRGINFVFVDWWADENELHHHVWTSPGSAPTELEYRGVAGAIACVWDAYLIGFERDAWVETVLRNPAGPDLGAYLERRLSEDV